jgi:hypothetical protein
VALAGLRAVAPWLSALHVFGWWPRATPLAAHAELLREALALAGDVDALLEFVPDHDPAVLAREAATLRAAGA